MKNWYAFIGCLVLSCSIWLVMNLSRKATSVETVQVLACSSIDGMSESAVEPVDITAVCSASGFRLLSVSMKDDVVRVFFSPSELKKLSHGLYSVDVAVLLHKVSDIFGPGVAVESYVQQSVEFRFADQAYRKVPVYPVSYVTYRSQYCALEPLSLSKDSVLVYGDIDRIQNVDRVRTVPITLHDIRRDSHGSVALQVPAGLRLSEKEVEYYLKVGRFVEMKTEVPVVMRDVPPGVTIKYYPTTVSVVWRQIFPVRTLPDSGTSFYIDFHDFENSITGKCVIKAANIPDGVISWNVEPQYCECVQVTSKL